MTTTTTTMPKLNPKDKPKKSRKNKGKKKNRMNRYSATTADRHVLYQEAVQSPEAELEFIKREYKKKFGRKPASLREDFCGTALLCCDWVKDRKQNTAIGVDIDADVLQWSRENNLAQLNDDQIERATLLCEDVLTADTKPVDVLVAFNFSYFLFMTRKDLLTYFRSTMQHLNADGMFILDCYGGYEAQDTVEEERPCNGFSYIWEQADFNPITHQTTCYIHFEFPDDTKMRRAFEYTWRLWTLPEIREILEEVGYRDVTVFWEGTDPETDEGDGEFKPTTTGEICPGWVAYIIAMR